MASKWTHRLSNIRPTERLADCAGCGADSPVILRRRRGLWVCRTAASVRSPEAVARRNADKRAYLKERRKRQHGLSDQAYDALLTRQGSCCAICLRPCPTHRALAIDHDHETGRVRGLLCMPCNTAIGQMGDDPERLLRAVEYLTN